MVSRRSFDVGCLVLACAAHVAFGHGRMIVPQARNMRDNGAVGGGPGSVHGANKYKHGICGNPASATQTYNRVGEVQSTYRAGEVAEIKLVITAHHVGFFEVELCTDAGQLSEECFASHRLLREGCTCSCPGESTNSNSCTECDECRRWWKPVVEVEENLYVTQGLGRSYSGPVLPGGNLVPYEFTLRYKIPAGTKTSRGVLRWHYVTTNSCTSSSASPEEFWNCADVAVTDSNGDTGPDLPYDNSALEQLHGENLFQKMSNDVLTGVYSGCPKDASGNLIGIGLAGEYSSLCGAQVGGVYQYCRALSSGSSTGSSSGGWSGGYPSGSTSGSGSSNTQPGSENGGSSGSTSGSGSSSASGSSTSGSTGGSSTGGGASTSSTASPDADNADPSGSDAGSGDTGAGQSSSGGSSSWPASTVSGDCDHVPSSGILCESDCSTAWFQCHGGVAFTQPVPSGTRCKDNQFVHEVHCAGFDPATGTSSSASDPKCANCNACLFANNVCYDSYNTEASCMQWPSNTWCGGQSLGQVGAHVFLPNELHSARRKGLRKDNFLGVALVQDKITVGRTTGVDDEAGDDVDGGRLIESTEL